MINKNFTQTSFCEDCPKYSECATSIYGLNTIEKIMLYKALGYSTKELNIFFEELLKNKPFTISDIIHFMSNKKDNCIYL